MKNLLAIVGVPGVGKSEASNFFKQKKIPVIRFGDITDEGLKSHGLPLTEVHEKSYREALRREFGMSAYAVKNEDKIRRLLKTSDIVVLDGLRSWEEYEYLKQKFPGLYLLAIYASPDIRHKRLRERRERKVSIEEAIKRDIAEIINLNMAPPIALADYLINNDSTLDELYKQLENLLRKKILL